MRHPGQRRASTATPGGGIQRAGRQLVGCALVAVLGATLAACQRTPRETPQAKAQPGDVLVRSGKTTVTLVKAFRQGEPNGLFDGVVRVKGEGNGQPLLMEINAICSLPGEPGWPPYDNVYGRTVDQAEEAEGRSGDTKWQVLYNFSGVRQVRMGQNPGPWTDRLRDNLCRRADFDDRPKK
jgi:hypothetical protein